MKALLFFKLVTRINQLQGRPTKTRNTPRKRSRRGSTLQNRTCSADLISGGELLASNPNCSFASDAPICGPQCGFNRDLLRIYDGDFRIGGSAAKLAKLRASRRKWRHTRGGDANLRRAALSAKFLTAVRNRLHNWNGELPRHCKLRVVSRVRTTIPGHASGRRYCSERFG
jgi:hypothetical protein